MYTLSSGSSLLEDYAKYLIEVKHHTVLETSSIVSRINPTQLSHELMEIFFDATSDQAMKEINSQINDINTCISKCINFSMCRQHVALNDKCNYIQFAESGGYRGTI